MAKRVRLARPAPKGVWGDELDNTFDYFSQPPRKEQSASEPKKAIERRERVRLDRTRMPTK
jgi:hypothetical protein